MTTSPSRSEHTASPSLADTAWTRRVGAEALGTFALVFIAAGADAAAVVSGGEVGVVARAVAPALMVAALIYALADASGAHFNPVVSLGFALERAFPFRWLVPYWLAQLAGAAAAALVLRMLFGAASDAGVSTPHVGAATAVATEAILTMLLVTVVLATADRARVIGPEAAIAVGATIAVCGLVALPLEGASMNPARSAGPALASGDFADLWIYVLGPVIGAAGAVLASRAIRGPARRDDRSTEAVLGDGAGAERRGPRPDTPLQPLTGSERHA